MKNTTALLTSSSLKMKTYSKTLAILLVSSFPTLQVSLKTVARARQDMGWVATSPNFCQLIRKANKVKRLEWYKQMIDRGEQF